MMIECPHCHMETEHKVIDHINIDRNPELRAKVQDLSVFRVNGCGPRTVRFPRRNLIRWQATPCA